MTVARSQNGYSANDRSLIASYTVPGTAQRVALRAGDTSVILLDIAAWVHANVERIDQGVFDDWGYAERNIRGSATTLSNHASGTAIDINATQHPLGVHNTWSAEEKRLIHSRLALYEGCLVWGEDWRSRPDGMHMEVARGAADCARVAERIRRGELGRTHLPAPTPRPRPVEDDAMYIKCQPPGQPVRVAILSGVMFVGLGSPGELKSAEDAIAKGAPVQWVEPVTWMDFDRRSHAVCDNPRPVVAMQSVAAGVVKP